MIISAIAPEIVLLCGVSLVLMIDVYRGERTVDLSFWATIASVLVALLTVVIVFPDYRQSAFSGTVLNDPIANVLRALILGMTVFALCYGRDYFTRLSHVRGEYYALTVLASLGAMVMVIGGNLLTLYLGLELMSLSLYAMVAIERDSNDASEAAIKYFVLGAIASGMLLYGISMIYGATGSLNLIEIRQAISGGTLNGMILLYGSIFLVVGVAFKLGLVPFHMWVPDVYQGAPTATVLFVGSVPKLAAFGLAYRIFAEGIPVHSVDWSATFYPLAALSIVFGNLIAIAQTNVKRMLAFSTIAHMGFLILGFLTATTDGYASAMFYAIVYSFSSMAAFALLIFITTRESAGQLGAARLEAFGGLARRSPWFGFLMAVVFFSLAGIPPFPGFWAKWFVIKEAVDANLLTLAVIAVVASVVGAFYYLRIIKIAFFDEPVSSEEFDASQDLRLVLTINVLLLIAIGILPSALMRVCLQVTAS